MDLDRELERTKCKAFLGKNGAFLGSLLCGLKFSWDKKIQTAGVTKDQFFWNPDWFESLTSEERVGVLMHELWHIARLHLPRGENKDFEIWNCACDYLINNSLVQEGYVLPKGALINFSYKGMCEEEIYSVIYSEPEKLQIQPWGEDSREDSNDTKAVYVDLVSKAITQSKGVPGSIPGDVEKIFDNFLRPKIPWTNVLRKYLLDSCELSWNWSKPNRRFRNIYMPSTFKESGRLTHLAFFLDTSGSISDEEIIKFNSELKFIQECLQPDKLTVVQFDIDIHKITVFNKGQRFKKIKVVGFGGTNYECVHDWIQKNKPTASIIFTDLYADEMRKVSCPVIWAVTSDLPIPFGKRIQI